VTLGAVALALQGLLPQISPVFQLVGSSGDARASAVNAVLLGCGLIVLTTALNSVRVSVLARVNNTGVVTELFGAILLAALLWAFAARSPVDVLAAGAGREARSLVGPLLGSALAASYVFYGFDTAGSLAEETKSPRRNAPRAILQAVAAAGIVGYVLLLGAMMAARDLSASELGRIDGGLPSIVTTALGGAVGRALLVIVIFAIAVCALAVHASAVRLVFAMARDGLLPGSRALATVSHVSKTPLLPVFVIGIGAVAMLIANINLPKLIELVTMIAALWANLAYVIVAAAVLRRRFHGWPPRETNDGAYFSLGRFGVPVNIAALLWSVFMVVNIGWPRAQIYGAQWQHRFAPIILTTVLGVAAVVAGTLAKRRTATHLAAPQSIETA
jgi:amino acid transporter